MTTKPEKKRKARRVWVWQFVNGHLWWSGVSSRRPRVRLNTQGGPWIEFVEVLPKPAKKKGKRKR